MQQRFLLQILLLAQHVSGTTIPIIKSSRVLYSGCCLWYFVLWFFKLLIWCGAEGYVSGLQDAAASCKPDTYDKKMSIDLHVKFTLFLDYNEYWIFSTDIRKILTYRILWNSVNVKGLTDRRDEANNRFRDFVKATKKTVSVKVTDTRTSTVTDTQYRDICSDCRTHHAVDLTVCIFGT